MDANTVSHFETLTRDREENARILAKRSMRGFWNSVVEKYSEQAHFVYELLQNADDAGASTVRFVLSEDHLLFAHNGARHFSITDPTCEEEDTNAGRLGDINAITSIANSTKGDEATIGKFGVGFKAVFQYTTTPYIYGPGIAFKIDDFIVPRLLKVDHPKRREAETLFVFPFDRPDMPSETAVQEISERLSALDYPTLFLRNLNELHYKTPSTEGCFSKRVLSSNSRNDVTAELLRMSKMENGTESIDELWLMSSSAKDGLTCSIGFFVGTDGLLRPVNRNAFCFFPTKVPTGLNFVVHAPFLLTDSREGIKEGAEHNIEMIGRLAKLSAASLPFLRDLGKKTGKRIIGDNLFDVIPYDWGQNNWMYREPNENSFTFTRICEAMRDVFSRERMLPGKDYYFKAEDSYIAETKRLSDLLGESQLRSLTGEDEAGKVLTSTFDRNLPTNLKRYLRKLGTTVIDENFLLRRLNERFTALQSLQWLSNLHLYLSETSSRVNQARVLPVFVDTEGRSVAAFDSEGNELLFLPDEDSDDVTIIEPASLNYEGTIALVETLRLKAPSLKARVVNKILPSYGTGRNPRDVTAFKAVFQCYVDEGESLAFLREVSKYPLLACVNSNGPVVQGIKPCDAYLPNDQLREYFSVKENVYFVDMEFYREIVNDYKTLNRFLNGLSIPKYPQLITRQVFPSMEPELRDHKWSYCSQNHIESWHETELDGCAENLNVIVKNSDIERSVMMWKALLSFVKLDCGSHKPGELLCGVHEFFYYSPGRESYVPTLVLRLRSSKWIVDREGNFVAPDGIEQASLDKRYDVVSDEAKTLAEFLGIVEPVTKELSEEEKLFSDLDFLARNLGNESFGALMSDQSFMADFKNLMRRHSKLAIEHAIKDDKTTSAIDAVDTEAPSEYEKVKDVDSYSLPSDIEDMLGIVRQDAVAKSRASKHSEEKDDFGRNEASAAAQKVKVRKHFRSLPGEGGLESVTNDIERRISKMRREKSGNTGTRDSHKHRDLESKRKRTTRIKEDVDEYTDDDVLIPSVVNYENRTERRRERCARDIDNIEREEHLRNSAILAETYSYNWFKCLIELESIYGSDSASSTEFSISFGKVSLEAESERTLVLEQPNRSIPLSVEDLSNIPLALELAERTTRVEIEVASVKNYTLRARLKDGTKLGGIDLTRVEEARIVVRNPTFLLEELRERFVELGFKGEYNMRDNLPENIEFVFGPPGTGKTTHLARNVLIPLMRSNEGLRVLVLAPTNKAADVLTRKVLECSGNAEGCVGWLVRFGITADAMLEELGIYRDKTFDFSELIKSVTITTIARYPYDYFMTEHGHQHIRDIGWDYIVFDEASMISCAQIVYPLHNAHPRKFIVAGDPHQIAPVVKVDLWQDENIYTMVGLNSFEKPCTIPYDYNVTLLTTQYRSVPAIGQVFSEFSYDGLLTSHRAETGNDRSYLAGILRDCPISIIGFPTRPYESIYKPKQLNRKSAYQPYSAILTYELVKKIACNVETNSSANRVSIGVVTPYRAQADLMEGLFAQAHIPSSVSIQTGTIHGFQGDECDVMVVLLNTPPSISANPGMFLNRRNILNVSVSRAKDTLILLVPDENTKGREKLREVTRLERICARTNALGVVSSTQVEEGLFGSATYIENNCFSTGHQSVNVYGRPDQRYEIRSEDHAVDLQIHEDVSSLVSAKSNASSM